MNGGICLLTANCNADGTSASAGCRLQAAGGPTGELLHIMQDMMHGLKTGLDGQPNVTPAS